MRPVARSAPPGPRSFDPGPSHHDARGPTLSICCATLLRAAIRLLLPTRSRCDPASFTYAPSRARLVGWMVRSTTGLARLRAGLPKDWVVGDKTGTGENGAANDVAVAWPPSRAPIVIASFIKAPSASADARNAAHAEVGRIVTEAFG
ncbi:serine hydrolase [Sorangium atrum]|nr:serine hydrolase [Sorangium aterium]